MRLGSSFWRFCLSTGLSNVADGMIQLMLPLLALGLTRSPLLISGLAVCSGLPWLGFGMVAGALVDRVDRRRALVLVNMVRAGLIAIVAVIASFGTVRLWELYLLAFGLGCLETIADTGVQSLVPSIVPDDQLDRANGRLYGIQVVGNYFTGPPLGGLLAGVSMALAVAGSSLAYVGAAVAVMSLVGRFRAQEAPEGVSSFRADVLLGLSFLWREAVLRRMALLLAGVSLIYTAVTSVLPLYAVKPGPMGLTMTGYGFFTAATAVGAIVASMVTERVIEAWGPSKAIKISIVAMTLSNTAPLAVNYLAVLAMWFVGAFFIVVFSVTITSSRQRLVPDHLRGRAQAAIRMAQWGAVPVGALAGGGLGQLIGLRPTFVLAGVATLLLLLSTLPLTDQALRGTHCPQGQSALS